MTKQAVLSLLVLVMLAGTPMAGASEFALTLRPTQDTSILPGGLHIPNPEDLCLSGFAPSRIYLKFVFTPPSGMTLSRARLLITRWDADNPELCAIPEGDVHYPECWTVLNETWDLHNMIGDVAPEPDLGPSAPPTTEILGSILRVDVYDVTQLVQPAVSVGTTILMLYGESAAYWVPSSEMMRNDIYRGPLLVLEFVSTATKEAFAAASWGAVKALYSE